LTTSFLAPGKGGRIVARAKVKGGGRTIYASSVEVSDDNGTLIAIGEGTFKYFKGSEGPEGVPVEG
jgi:acyl-coenzyme A thioesterase PaaI-like protein